MSEFTHAAQAVFNTVHSTMTGTQYATKDGQGTHPAPTGRFPYHPDAPSAQALALPPPFPCHQLTGLGRPSTPLYLPLLATGLRLTQTFLESMFLSQTCSNVPSFRPVSHVREVSGTNEDPAHGPPAAPRQPPPGTSRHTDFRSPHDLSVGSHPFPSPRCSKDSLPSG